MNPRVRTGTVLLGVLLGAVGLNLAGVLPASAHVSVTASSTTPGSSTQLTLAVPHGCEGSATTRIAVQMPAGINAAVPTVNPGWTVKKIMKRLDTPVTDSHGSKITSRVEQVIYTARTPLPDGFRDTFGIQVTIPDVAAGTAVAFPTVQTCVQGETAWIEIPKTGESIDDLAHPAPTIVIRSAGPTPGEGTSGPDHASSVQLPTSGGTTNTLGFVVGGAGLVAGLSGLAVGTVALRRISKTAP